MTVLEFVIFLIAGAICASIAGSLLGVRAGLLGSVVVGWVGAFVGTWAARETGLPELYVLRIGDGAIPIVWTIAGAFLLLLGVGLVRRPVRG